MQNLYETINSQKGELYNFNLETFDASKYITANLKHPFKEMNI